MRNRTFVSICGLAALLVAPAFAQEGEMPQMTPEQQAEMEAYMKAGALGPQHEAMAKHVGTYDVAIKSWMDPAAPPMESKGMAIRTLHMGGRVMHEEFQGDMMGMPFTGLSRSGYDNVSGKYWSTWTDSMSTGIMVAEGANYIVSGEWWLAIFPGLALMLAVFTFNLMGDGLRDLVDPQRRT